jgi:hypothetical protein
MENAQKSNRKTEDPKRGDRAHTLALMCSPWRGIGGGPGK